ncbi:MAG: arsenical pump-driving ATPase [Candidatus Tectomicrobia bacterium]|uniref:arsenite-transporting ATPase n=1 Tax=Tectimicrobiota bacterium TaxID=2528274 RepID=A0A933GLC6_UNCTE|nr:arsenical pump-driving ATPase [Candidatus Tectomicrobia bacterium]
MLFVENPTRNLFFTGKGGVGKTVLSCATAVALAERGKSVLLVSTDPASNLEEVLEVKLSSKSTAVTSVPGLRAMNIDSEAAAREYRERIISPYKGVLPDAVLASIEEQLSGACTVEIAAFNEFSKLLGDQDSAAGFDHLVFDTAPTGHTLRLLELPAAWSGFLKTNTVGTSCIGPLAGLQEHHRLYEATLRTLSDPANTTLVLVSRPENSALAEAERARAELSALGIRNQCLILNGVFKASLPEDPIAFALERRGQAALQRIPSGLLSLHRYEIPLLPFGLLGVDALKAIFSPKSAPLPKKMENPQITDGHHIPPTLASFLPEISGQGRGVIMTMGKGGVGKTSVASAIAVELARLGHQVHLTTTDPAAHLDASLTTRVPGLKISRIDPATETLNYREEVLARSEQNLDDQGRKLLEEDLNSPCTEEIAVFQAFARVVSEGKNGFVVLDTAPTGHTLLLLDATEAYHRQVSKTLSDLPGSVRELLPSLRDPEFTKILIVTLPEATPVHEAAQLQADLVRAGINPFAWVINQSLLPLDSRDPLLLSRREREYVYLKEVREKHASRLALIPWMIEEPIGPDRLRKLVQGVSPNP